MNSKHWLAPVCFSVLFLLVFCFSDVNKSLAQDVGLSVRSKNKIAGHSKRTNTSFSSVVTEDNMIETDVYLGDKHISVGVGYGKKAGEIYILGRETATSNIVTMNANEANVLKQDLEALIQERLGTNRVEKNLLSVFNLLSSWPENLDLIVDASAMAKSRKPSDCSFSPINGCTNICSKVNETNIAAYATQGQTCRLNLPWYTGIPGFIIEYFSGMVFYEPTQWTSTSDYIVGGPECIGRCGAGCIGDGGLFNNSVNRYTQSCFNHDVCGRKIGLTNPLCNWMFISCIDDFLAAPICPALDLIFVIDTTGSMWDDIANVKAAAADIVNSIDSQISDYRVALVDYRDFPIYPYGGAGDYPYHVILPFSTDKSAIVNAIQSLSLGWGADWQESVYSALIRAINTENLGSWRNGITKVVIVMGDAPPHDPEPITGYTEQSVVNAALAVDPAIIYSIVIGGDPTTYGYFSALSEQTGGSVFTAPTAQTVVDALLDAIGEATSSNHPPDCNGAFADVSQVWPPNHKMVPIKISNVQDPDNDPVTITITGITQSEPVAGLFTDDQSPDGSGVGTDTALIRAERQGKSKGRVYRISFTASDNRGGECSGTVLTCVPHDQGVNVACTDNAKIYDSTLP